MTILITKLNTAIVDSIKDSRFSLIFQFLFLTLLISTGTRSILLLKSLSELDVSFSLLTNIYLTGAIFDLTIAFYFISPFVIYLIFLPNRVHTHCVHKYFGIMLYITIIFGIYFTVVAEWLFWDEFGVRFNFISVDYLIYRHEVTNNLYESYPVAWILVGVALISIGTFWLMKKPVLNSFSHIETLKNRAKIGIPLLIFPILFYSFVDKSLMEISNNRYATELAGNGIYQFFYAFNSNKLDFDLFYTHKNKDDMSEILKSSVKTNNSTFLSDGLFDITRYISTAGEEKNYNIILLTVESLSAEFFGAFGNKENITPNLDDLSEQGLLFTNFYATGTRTVRGLEALTLSIPPTPGRSIVKREHNDNLFSLGYVLRQHDYSTKYFYGGYTYFDNMKTFFNGNGYDVIDKSDFTNNEISFSNAWGVADEDLYRRVLKEANKEHDTNTPFFYHIMTTSNHRPYTYPDGKIDIPSGTGRSGAVKYTDLAIKNFIEAAKKQPWFDNTLFVIVADHCANSAGKSALPINRYHIPLIVYAPKLIKPQKIDTLSSQIDVAPTLLGLLNIAYKSQFFGKDILNMSSDDGRALIGNYQRLGLLKNNILSYLSPQNKVTIIDKTTSNTLNVLKEADKQYILSNTIAFYQGANYILKHNMNRLSQNKRNKIYDVGTNMKMVPQEYLFSAEND